MIPDLQSILSATPDRYPKRLDAQFPRIVQKIALLWGTEGMRPYFKELMLDQRGGRQGFAPEILSEIFALSNYYDTIQPSSSPTVEQQWSDAGALDRLGRFNRQT